MNLYFSYEKALELMKEDVSEYNVFRLARWLSECRGCLVFVGDDITTLEIDVSTSNAVFDFYEKWIEHTKNICDTDDFKTAIHMQGLHRCEITLNSRNSKTDITDELYPMFEDKIPFCSMAEQISKKEVKRFKEYKTEINSFLIKGRTQLPYLIEELKEVTIKYEINALANEFEGDATKSWKELLTLLSRRKLISTPKKICKAPTKSEYILNRLRQANVGKNAYYPYIDKDSKFETQKVFCTNLAFFLCLTLDEAEALHNNEGYTIDFSKRESDNILKNCFKYGLSWEYANVLLKRYGYKYLDRSRPKKRKSQ